MAGHDGYRRAPAAERTFLASLRRATACLAIGLGGCSGNVALGDYPASTCDLGEAPDGIRDMPINIATFWAEDTREDMAFGELTRFVDRDKYFVRIDEMPDRVATQRHIRDAFENQYLPDLFQVNGGSDVLGWVDGRQGDARDLCALDALRDENRWKRSYFQAALDPLSCEGSLYALPVGIHHINVLFYNRPLFEKLATLAGASGMSLTRPEDLESPWQLVELVKQVDLLNTSVLGEDERITPLAIGSRNDWPLTIMAFENVLLGLGFGAYETLFEGGLENDDGTKAAALEGALREMLEILRALVAHSNYDESSTWQEALQQVGSEKALFTVTGDWGYAQFDAAQIENVATVSFPGTKGTFVYTPDSFAVPRDSGKNGFQARAFLNDAAQDKAALIAFANVKHAIPPRVDLEEAELGRLSSPGLRATYDDFSRCARGDDGCRLLLAVSGLGPSPGADPCLDEVDALLGLAVAHKPIAEASGERSCREPLPNDAAQAEARLLELWLALGQRRYAASCR